MPAQSQPEEFRVTGDSMDRAGLVDGMYVPVRPGATARHGDVAVVRQADESHVIKRLHQTTPYEGKNAWWSGAWLVPDSTDPRHRPRPLWEGDTIVGVVTDLAPRDKSHWLDSPNVLHGRDLWPSRVVEIRREPAPVPIPGPPPPPPWPRDVFALVPLAEAPRRLFTKPVASCARKPEADLARLPFGGVVGIYEDIDPWAQRLAWVSAEWAQYADYVVIASDDSMGRRGIQEGDLLYVRRVEGADLWSGLVVIASLGDLGSVCGELHVEGGARFIRSNQSLPASREMHVEIASEDIQGLVFVAEG